MNNIGNDISKYIGLSGWSYPGWEEKFYHQKLNGLEQLRFYGTQFNTVEINYSFYHIPKAQTFTAWASVVPKDFRFSVKLHRMFTHDNYLILTDDLPIKLKTFLDHAGAMGEKFAALLVQTPKSLPYDLERLRLFLQQLSKVTKALLYTPRVVFEFRNEQWLQQTTYDVLEEFKAGLVISQSSRYPIAKEATSNILYFRFHGPEKMFDSSYTETQLSEHKKFIDGHTSVKDFFAYFNNTMHGQAIDDARKFKSILG